jgi:hypothetical protein
VANCSLEVLAAHTHDLCAGAVPVGSVEFVRRAMELVGIYEPENISYPEHAQRFLRRSLRRTVAGQVLGRWFVKPIITKAFTGFVFDSIADRERYDLAARDSFDAFMAMPADAPVWIAEPVAFQSEWRYYVHRGQVVGSARYDPDGEEGAVAPDIGVVLECVRALHWDRPYALDMGVLTGGETALVEVNDFWAIGLYGRALTADKYLEMLCDRWAEMRLPWHKKGPIRR